MQNTEKQKVSNQIERQNNENWNITLTQEDKIKIELIKKIMTEKKTALPSLRNQDWKKS